MQSLGSTKLAYVVAGGLGAQADSLLVVLFDVGPFVPGLEDVILLACPLCPATSALGHSPRLQRVVQGESVYLEVGGVSGMPVTFTSFDLGAFDNDLNSITVRADERGRARVKFTATPGTINDIHILAASPVTSGQMRYLVNVRLPEATGGR